jgi:formylmethanofuran dehydrogenase subunit E
MVRVAVLVCLCWLSMLAFGEEAPARLPEPDYHRLASDPAWLAQVVQFHGHLGPAVVAGARIGMAGLRAVEARGYFDVEVTCEGPLARPPRSCFLDGLQMGTGATMGKRTLHWIEAERIVVRVKNTRTGKTAGLSPTPVLLDLLAAFKPQPRSAASPQADHKAVDEHLEAIARKIAALPEKDLVTIRQLDRAGVR